MKTFSRIPASLALAASALGLTFAALSTYDYVQHLDRQLHDIHCSFIPGLGVAADAANPCRAAMYSSYSAVFRGTWWGGVPISLFALGMYAFFAAFATALLVAGPRGSRRAYQFFGAASIVPLLVSVVMAFISAIELGVFCKTCVGLYASSALLAVGGIWGMAMVARIAHPPADATVPDAGPEAMPQGNMALIAASVAGLGACVLIPAMVYVASLPDYRSKLLGCGKLESPSDKALISLTTTNHGARPATVFADPLCPSCKGLHDRLHSEGAMPNLKVTLALLPLDSECNWMLDRSLHPGACTLSKAVLCAESHPLEALEWMYDNQDSLAELGKAGDALLRARLRERFGQQVEACIDSRATKLRLNSHLQFAVANQVTVSTPQLYLGDQRICDEDTDLGLRYTLTQLAPEVLQ